MLIACPHCLTLNRVPDDRLDERPRCGHCHDEVLPDRPVALTDDSFDPVIQRTGLPVVVDFWAAWCGPCRAMAPQFEQAARRLRGRTLFAKVDTETSPRVSLRHRIRSIPTLVLWQGGQERRRISGALPARELLRWLQAPDAAA